MRVEFLLDLGGGAFRRGEVKDLPDDTARALVLAGYAAEPTDVLVPDGEMADTDAAEGE
jgi:hypothetical protein